MNRDERVVGELVSGYGRTYASEAGIRPADTPQPLYRLLVLSLLLSARIRASAAVAAARAPHEERLDTRRRMADADRRRRVEATATLPRRGCLHSLRLRSARRRRRAVGRALGAAICAGCMRRRAATPGS